MHVHHIHNSFHLATPSLIPTHFFCSIKFLNFPPKRMKQNMGHTALMLSGGGAQAMYHLGTFKALIESGLYEHIHVVSGTSGGR